MARHTPGADDDDGLTPGHELFAPPPPTEGSTAASEPSTGTGTDTGPRFVAWSHRDAGSDGDVPAAGSTPVEAADDDDPAPRSGRRRLAIVGGVVAGAALVSVVVSAVLFTTGSTPFAAGAPTETPRPTTVARTSSPSASASPSPSPLPTASSTPSPRAATPPPQDASVPAPFVTPVAAGTVVAEADVASPKGSVHFHYRVVAVGDDTYSAELTNATSSLPVPVTAAFFEIAPSVGDGVTYGGDGGVGIGGLTTTPTSASGSFGAVSQPSYLSTLVVYSTSTSSDVPVELATGKVLAVAPVAWSVPARQTNIAPVDSGATAFATGTLEATTASGAPKRYTVAPGDLVDVVAQRFGVSVSALLYLNQGLQVIDDEQHLFEGTTLVLDPDSV